MSRPKDPGELPNLDSRNAAGAQGTSSSDWSAPPPAPTGPGIGTPYLKPAAYAYTPAGGPDPHHPHLFHLQSTEANAWEGGSLQGANSENWPILVNQKGAVYLARLKVGGIREPHWHPSAWELNFVISGRVRWSFVGPNSSQDVFEGGAGDLIMAPQGHFHYFENASATEDLIVLIVFNADAAEPKDDISLSQSISSVPAHVRAAVFGVRSRLGEGRPRRRSRAVARAASAGRDRRGCDCARPCGW